MKVTGQPTAPIQNNPASAPVPTPAPTGPGQTIASGLAGSSSALAGSVSIATASHGSGVGATQTASGGRLAQLAHGLAMATKAAVSTPLGVVGLIGNRIEANKAAKQEAAHRLQLAQENRDNLRAALGQPDPNGILNKTIVTKDHPNGATVDQLMDAYHQKLQGTTVNGVQGHPFTQASAAEMKMFVQVGEKVAQAIDKWDGNLPLTTTINGQPVIIPSNLDTARSLSWYLQAKGMMDNASPTRDNVDLGSGTMIVKDPGNKLYKFLGSADNCYGRYSSHFKDGRAEHGTGDLAPGNSKRGFTAPMLGGIQKQSLQNGIEDFTNKFPSNGGTLLFEKLKGSASSGEIFLKWESVGVPDAIGSGRRAHHGDVQSEKATFGMAANRCMHHTFNFLGPMLANKPVIGGFAQSLVEAKNTAIVARGEQMDKLVGKETVEQYKELMTELLGKEAKTVKPYNVEQMFKGLDAAIAKSTNQQTTQDLLDMRSDLTQAIRDRGEDLGMLRQGGETHVALN